MHNCPIYKNCLSVFGEARSFCGNNLQFKLHTTNLSVINSVPLPSSLSLIWTVVEGCSCLIPSVGGGKLLRTTIPRIFTSLNIVITLKLIVLNKEQRGEAVGNYAICRFLLLVNCH